MLAKVTEGSISLPQIQKMYEIRKSEISMIAVMNLDFIAKLKYIIEAASKLSLPVDL